MNDNCKFRAAGAPVDCFDVVTNQPDAPIIMCPSCLNLRVVKLEVAIRKLSWMILTQESFGPNDAVAIRDILENSEPDNREALFGDQSSKAFSFLDDLNRKVTGDTEVDEQ